MNLDKKLLKEIERHHRINKYISELALPAEGDVPPAATEPGALPAEAPADAPAPDASTPPTKIDVKADADVTKIDDEGDTDETSGGSEELDVTDLVKSQEKIEQKQEEYFNNLFGYIQNLESKLGEMGQVIDRLNAIETKIEKYREKTPQEKLQLRSLDSGPFNQKLSDFFDDKKEDFEKAGKHEYVLTSDEIENVNPSEIKSTFRPDQEEEDKFKF